jgi:hypothetical protein
MGSIIRKFMYKRECQKCKLIELEMTDLFNEVDTTRIPIIELIKTRRIRVEQIKEGMRRRKQNINRIYRNELYNHNGVKI